jgi:vaccinia related kinase
MDLKGTNILLGFGKSGDEHVHLLDYGLACHYSTKEYKVDPKKAHNGTIEYLSRDSHNGVPTMRGDIEILAYNLIEWAGAKLPWTASQSILDKPVEVQKLKESFMKDVEKSLKTAFGTNSVPSQLAAFMKYVESLNHDSKPDYDKIRGMFESGLKELKASNSGKLEFVSKTVTAKSPMKRPQAAAKDNASPAKKPREAAGPSKKPEPVKKAAPKAKVVAPSPPDSDTEEEPVTTKSKRVRDKPRYKEVSEDEDEDEGPKKKSKSKTSSKSENKSTNDSPKKVKASAAAKGQVVLKAATGKGTSSKKVVTLNFDLDISYDSDLVVTVNRKDKKKKTEEKRDGGGGEEEKSKEENPNRAGFYKGKFSKA